MLNSFTALFFPSTNKKNPQAFQPQFCKHLINFLCNPEQRGEVAGWRGWFLTGGEGPVRCGLDGSFRCDAADSPIVSELKKSLESSSCFSSCFYSLHPTAPVRNPVIT